MAIARVEPLITARALRGPFDYALPERLADVGVGSVLLVPFGPRRLLGVVVDVGEESELDPARLVEPVRAIAAGVTPELVRLGLWVGERVLLNRGERARAGSAAGHRLAREAARAQAGAARGDHAGRRRGPGRRGTARAPASERCSAGWTRPRRELTAADIGVDRAALRRLEQRGFVSRARGAECTGARTCRSSARSPGRVELNPDQRRAVDDIVAALDGAGQRTPAPRRHRLGQDRGLPRGRGGGARARARRDRARPRDRAHAADAWALPRPAGRARRAPSLPPLSRRAPRRVAAPALRRGARGGRPALGHLRARRRPRARDRRRGTRDLLQAGGRPTLRRSRRRAPPRGGGWGGARRRHRDPAPGELELGSSGSSCRSGPTARSLPEVEVLDMRGAQRARRPASPAHAGGARRRGARRRQGDRPRQPARLGSVPRLPLVRARLRLSRTATCPWSSTPLESALSPLRAPRADARRAATSAARSRWPSTVPAPSARSAWSPSWSPRCPCSASTPTRRPGRGAHAEILSRFDSGPGRRAARHADGREGPRLPRRDAGRRARRRRHPAVPGLPRRGADVRADRAAGRAQRPGRRGRAGAGPDAGPGGGRDSARGAPRRRGLPRRRARAPRARCSTRRSRTWSGSS